jgi:hypothetical protein
MSAAVAAAIAVDDVGLRRGSVPARRWIVSIATDIAETGGTAAREGGLIGINALGTEVMLACGIRTAALTGTEVRIAAGQRS